MRDENPSFFLFANLHFVVFLLLFFKFLFHILIWRCQYYTFSERKNNMDKQTLSNYGWIVVCVLVLAVLIALATPFGTFVQTGVHSAEMGLISVSGTAMEIAKTSAGLLSGCYFKHGLLYQDGELVTRTIGDGYEFIDGILYKDGDRYTGFFEGCRFVDGLKDNYVYEVVCEDVYDDTIGFYIHTYFYNPTGTSGDGFTIKTAEGTVIQLP